MVVRSPFFFPCFSVCLFFSKIANCHLIYTTVALKPNNDSNKVAKKRGRTSARTSPTKKSAATVVDSSDDNQVASDVKAEGSDTD